MFSKKFLLTKFARLSVLIFSFVCLQKNVSAQWVQNQNLNGGNKPQINNSSINLPNANVLDGGTVVTGVLQEDLSSKNSKAADIFSIMLPENYLVNDRLLIPQYSKFVGTIVSVSPAKQAHYGNPGNLQISIQTLVSPEGISIPVTASIDYNPNQPPPIDTKKSRGIPVGEWGKSAIYSVYYYGGSLGSRMGVPFLYKGQTNGGKDFSLSKGELIPVRLTEPLDVTPLLKGTSQLPPPNLVPPQMPDATNPAGPEPF